MGKRTIALLLTVIMVIGFVPLHTYAAEITGDGYLFDSDSGTLTITSDSGTINWRNDTGIGSKSSIKKLVIENSVTAIQQSAFSWCDSLITVTIPDSVNSIGNYAFDTCSKLVAATFLGSTAPVFGTDVFSGCYRNFRIYYPFGGTGYDSLNYTAYRAPVSGSGYSFEPATGTLTISSNNGTKNWCTFIPPTIVTSLVIEEGVTFIGESAFAECKYLREVELPDSLTSLGADAFDNCSALTEITIPDGVTSIPEWTFFSCQSLSSVAIPDGVTFIGDYAFTYCPLATLNLPKNLTSIGTQAFYGNQSLEALVISDKVTNIGTRAFFGCMSLKEITIPAGVASIGNDAFAGCTSLASATFKGLSAPTFGTSVFTKYAEGGVTIYYPVGGTDYDILGYPAQSPSGIDVPVNGNLKITFKVAMDTSTIGTVTLSFDEGSAVPNSAGGSWSSDSRTYTVPYSDLAYGKTYDVAVSGFKSAAGNSITMSAYSFTTDFLPVVSGVTPSGTAIPVNGNLEITFSETMETDAGTVSLDGGTTSLTDGSWFEDSKTYTIPYLGLSYETEYIVSISGFKDVAGNEMTADSTHSFITAALVPVTGITGVPTAATVGTDLTLSGSVTPTEATNQTIIWSVKDSGTTGATISGNALSTTATGTVTITATIADGTASGTAYTQDFTITVNAAAPTDKILVSITAPAAITGLTNGTAKTASALGLPSTVTLVTNNGSVSANITWDVDSCSYDTSLKNVQTFTVSGTVTLPDGVVNPNNVVSLTISVSVTVNAASAASAELSLVTGSFDRNPANQADVQTTITWGDATGVTDVKAGGSSIGTGNYNISANTLTIKREYLAAQATGILPLTVEFNAGAAATLTISITDTTPPVISPASHNYDLNSPADVTTAITWNSAVSVTDVVYSVSPDTTLYTLDTGDYTVSDDTLTISGGFLSGISLTTGAALEFDITFNTEATATMTVNVVNNYTPSDDADLNSLSVNGTPVNGFDPDDTEYDVVLPYGAASATVTATASDSKAQVSITQASSLPGSAIVTVTAEDGTTSRTYTINLTIAAPPTTYTVTFSSNGSVYATKTANAGETIGGANWPSNPVRSSYAFGGWFTGENGTGVQFTYDTPVNAATTVYAKWTYNGGGGSSSGGGSTASSKPTYKAEVKAGDGSNSTLPVTVDTHNGNASVDVGTGSNLISDGKTSVITVPTVPDVDTYTLGIPVPNLTTTYDQGEISFKTDNGSVTVPSNMLTGIEGISGSKAQISIGQGDKDNLPDDVKAAIGDRPLIQLTLSIDGTQTDWSNPNAAVTVSIPYTPIADELKNPESIVIWYIDGSGNVVTIPNGHYDPATGMVTFDTTHFSDYAVAYNKVSFNDVAAGAWYNKAVSFIAARGITGGKGSGNYSPDAKLTRGEFLVMLMKAYGIAPGTNSADNFSDAGNTYYTDYLAAAKRLGITTGIGNNQYAPDKEITRQEMFTLLYNALKVMGQLPQGDSGKALSDFADAGQIDSWAKDAMTLLVKTGTIGGSNGALTPLSTTSRAEMAQVLYNLLGK